MDTEFGKKLAEARKQAGLTQAAAAQQSGCSVPALQRYESGQTCPTVRVLVDLVRVYGVAINDIIDSPISLPAGHVLVDQAKVDRVLATTDSKEIAKEFTTGGLVALDWHAFIPAGARIVSAEEARAIARELDAHVFRHAEKELRQAMSHRLREINDG